MQNLSFAAQVEALGAHVRVLIQEQERLDAERASSAPIKKSSAKKPKVETSVDRIVAVMRPFTAYRWGPLKKLSGLRDGFGAAVDTAVRNKRIDKTYELGSPVFSLPL